MAVNMDLAKIDEKLANKRIRMFEVNDDKIIIEMHSNKYIFKRYGLLFSDVKYENVFANKNNKTVKETLEADKYSKLFSEIMARYNNDADKKLGAFLLKMKNTGDILYKSFLNSYGDEIYVEFKLLDKSISNSKGLYLYFINDDIKYIGKTTDTIKKRINDGYGKIHPKNCYLDGQSTNCHINSLIARNNINDIKFYFLELNNSDNETIGRLEEDLIKEYSPEWNRMLKQKRHIEAADKFLENPEHFEGRNANPEERLYSRSVVDKIKALYLDRMAVHKKNAEAFIKAHPKAYKAWRKMLPDRELCAEDVTFPDFVLWWNFYHDDIKNPRENGSSGRRVWRNKDMYMWLKSTPESSMYIKPEEKEKEEEYPMIPSHTDAGQVLKPAIGEGPRAAQYDKEAAAEAWACERAREEQEAIDKEKMLPETGRGIDAFEKNDFDTAIECILLALEKDEKNKDYLNKILAGSYYNKGQMLSAKNNYDEAIKNFRDAIQIDATIKDQVNPFLVQAYCKKGDEYFNKNEYGHAMNEYSNALNIEENINLHIIVV